MPNQSRHALLAAGGFTLLFGWLFAYPPLHHGYLAESDLYEFFLPTFLSPMTRWSSFEFGGMPAFADPGDTFFYPVHLFARALGSWFLVFVAAYVLAASGMYAYVYALTRSKTAALFSGLAYALSEAMMERLSHLGVVQTMGWFAWIALAVDRLRGPHPWRWMALGAFFVGCCFLAGNPQMFLYAGIVFGLYAIAGAIAERPARRCYVAALGMAGLGLMLTAVKTLPVIEASRFTARQVVNFGAFVSHSNTPAQMLSIFFPTILHEGREAPTYVGMATLAFAVTAARLTFRNWRVGFWLMIVCMAFLIGAGSATPLARLAYDIPLFDKFRVVARHLIFAAFGLVTLAGLAIGAVRSGEITRRAFGAGVAIVLLAMAVAAVVLLRWPGAFEYDDAVTLPWRLPIWNDGVWAQIIIAAITIAASVAFVVAPRSVPAAAFLIVMLAADLVHALPYHLTWSGLETPFVPADAALNPSVHAIALARDLELRHQRLLSAGGTQIDSVVPAVFARVWRIPSAGGYGPMLLSRYSALTQMGTNGSVEPAVLAPHNAALNVAAVKYVLVHPDDFASPRTIERNGLLWTSDPVELFVGPPECGQRFPRTSSFGLPATIDVVRIAIVTHLRCAEDVVQGSPVVTVTVSGNDGVAYQGELRAGHEVADEQLANPAVRGRAKHEPAEIFDAGTTPFTYYTALDLKSAVHGARIELTVHGTAGWLVIDRVTAVDAAGHGHPQSIADLLLSDPLRWRPAGEFATSRTSDRGRDETASHEEAYRVFENRRARARAWLAHDVVPLPVDAIDRSIHFSQLPDGQPFDDERMALVESGALPSRRYPDDAASVAVQSVTDGDISVAVSSGGGFLVLSETFYPGWHARIDDRETPIYRTDGALQGVVVPAGRHIVHFQFTSTTLRAGAAVTLFGVVGVVVVLWRTRPRLHAVAPAVP